MNGKRSASLIRPTCKNNSKKRKTLQRHNEQPSADIENLKTTITVKRQCTLTKNIDQGWVKEKSVDNKRKVLANISNAKFQNEKSKCERLAEKRKKCLKSVKTVDLLCAIRNATLPLSEKTSELPVEINEGEVLTKNIKNFEDLDEQQKWNSFAVPMYAKAIFENLKQREAAFPLNFYIHRQLDIGAGERTVVVDWIAEVQESFALTHETLYLAVKILDHYLCNHLCLRKELQLLGITSVLIAAKFVECFAPRVDDLVHVCAGEYPRQSLIEMERKILQGLEFNINIPIAYSFLRRYGQCAKVDLVTLTLARYICERTLQEMEFLVVRASHLAASSLLLAMKMKGLGGWTPILTCYTGYEEIELLPLVKKLNILISKRPHETLRTVYNKYSDSTFLKVAQIPPLDPSEFSDS
ncbi:G2/mitotic-specific cyclin-B3-like isoform X2 [Pleurodeles waltl]|uniref:G2/mitotic-specific cyclin-B3-like isoform X2 n=1 Tax=Pleurodeles waltl TaxID=8319 RepID=UPI00370963CB